MNNAALVFTPEFVERGYNNRAAVPDHPRGSRNTRSSRRLRASATATSSTCATVPSRSKRSISSCPTGTPRGTFVFIHGGYWRALDKDDFSFVAGPFVEQGSRSRSSITTCARRCRSRRSSTNAGALCCGSRARAATMAPRPSNVVVGGHSAGGHLAAMMFATDWDALGLKSRAVRRRGHAVRRARPDAARPVLRSTPTCGSTTRKRRACRRSTSQPVAGAVADRVGGAETSEFLRQSQLLWDAWPDNRRPAGGTARPRRQASLQRRRRLRRSGKRPDARHAGALPLVPDSSGTPRTPIDN